MPLSPRAAEAHTGPALRNAPGDAALSRHTPAGTLQVAAYDSFAILRPDREMPNTPVLHQVIRLVHRRRGCDGERRRRHQIPDTCLGSSGRLDVTLHVCHNFPHHYIAI